MFPLAGVLTYKQVATSYGHYIILLFMGGFRLSRAMEKSGAHRRVALSLCRMVGGAGGRWLGLGFMIASAALSMWITNTATTLMLLPIALAVLEQADDKDLAVPLLLGIAYAASIGGLGTPIGSPPNAYFMAYLRSGLRGSRSQYRATPGRAVDFFPMDDDRPAGGAGVRAAGVVVADAQAAQSQPN